MPCRPCNVRQCCQCRSRRALDQTRMHHYPIGKTERSPPQANLTWEMASFMARATEPRRFDVPLREVIRRRRVRPS